MDLKIMDIAAAFTAVCLWVTIMSTLSVITTACWGAVIKIVRLTKSNEL